MRSVLLVIVLFTFSFLSAQTITWSKVEKDYLPKGVTLYKGERVSPKLQAFYLEADIQNSRIALRPYQLGTNYTVKDFIAKTGAIAAVNGGFFGGSTSYSSVIYPGEIKAINVNSVTRDAKSYPLMRSLFSIDTLNNPHVDWVYHFDNTLDGLFKFAEPLPYTENDPDPKPAPQKSSGEMYNTVLTGIGGGPTLVKNSMVQVTYNEEIMWGSGVGLDNRDPRTAVGYTSDQRVILLVADGRQTVSEGLSLPELAQVMIDLGCVEAMNLDGGGSSQMAGGNEFINSPSEQRAVPSIFAIVDYDSLGLPKKPLIEKIIDTSDSSHCRLIGNGWFESANEGFYGGTKSLLNEKGDGTEYALFKPEVPVKAEYELYAWWVAAFNRCTDTPFIVNHTHGTDTVKIDQAANGSSWNLIGKYEFSGDSAESIIISEAAQNGTYIVADAIKLVSFDTTSISSIEENQFYKPYKLTLQKNYPNPFNNSTTINYLLSKNSNVLFSVYDIRGKLITRQNIKSQVSGRHSFSFDATGLSSGIYVYSLRADNEIVRDKMILIK
ncbi:MAG: phosphodiester glycosidase family protein [Calditrichaeota bacterium]|nr:phosphodiester glycosidase family protein [Calditrichota bacterium]